MRPISILSLIIMFAACNFSETSRKQNNSEAITGVRSDKSVYKQDSLDRKNYQLNYFSNWTIDSTDEDFSLDSYFSILSPSKSGHVIFFMFNTIMDESACIQSQIDECLSGTMKDGIVTNFENWGQYKGRGAILKGKIVGIWNGEIKVFAHSNNNGTFLVISQYSYRYRDEDLPGLRLIESTFKLK